MKKSEIQNELDNVTMELRSLMDAVKDTNKEINLEEVRKNKAELEARRSNLEKQLAECEKPVETVAEKRGWKDLVKGMKEKRTVTVSGTGNAFVAHDLKLAVQKISDILAGASYYYGANATSVIPVFPQNVAAAFVSEAGTVTPATQTMSRKQLVLGQAIASLPVTQMTLDLSASDFEARLPEIMGNSMTALMAQEMLTGTGTNMTGIFTDSNISLNASAGESITIANLAKLAIDVRSKKYANPVIIMSPTVYGQFLADSSTDDTTKIVKEDLIRNKTVEGVKVIVSGYAPVAYSSGSIIAVAGDLSNYAIGLANEVTIKAKDTASSDLVTFDGYSYIAGGALIPADFIGFKVA